MRVVDVAPGVGNVASLLILPPRHVCVLRAAGEYLSFSASVYLDCPAEQMFQCTADKNKEVEARGSLPSPLSLSLLLFQW
jgi:hypothetical protein